MVVLSGTSVVVRSRIYAFVWCQISCLSRVENLCLHGVDYLWFSEIEYLYLSGVEYLWLS